VIPEKKIKKAAGTFLNQNVPAALTVWLLKPV